MGGWATYPSEIYDGVKVSWDDEIPIYEMERHKIHVPNHQQPDKVIVE